MNGRPMIYILIVCGEENPKLADQPIAFFRPEPKFPKPSSLSSPSAAPHAAMSVDYCIVPLPTPLSEGAPLLKAAARCGFLPSLSELDPYATAAAELGAASAWCGDAGKGGCTVGELPGTRSVPNRYHLAISSRDDPGCHRLRPLIPSRDDSGLNLRQPALYEISRDRLLFLLAFTINPFSFRA